MSDDKYLAKLGASNEKPAQRTMFDGLEEVRAEKQQVEQFRTLEAQQELNNRIAAAYELNWVEQLREDVDAHFSAQSEAVTQEEKDMLLSDAGALLVKLEANPKLKEDIFGSNCTDPRAKTIDYLLQRLEGRITNIKWDWTLSQDENVALDGLREMITFIKAGLLILK